LNTTTTKSRENYIKGWRKYLIIRNILDEDENERPNFPAKYGVQERDKFYASLSKQNWSGSDGFDSVLIAYDSLLSSKENWEELCWKAMLHGGENDATGCIAGSLYGALYGLKGVPVTNYKVTYNLVAKHYTNVILYTFLPIKINNLPYLFLLIIRTWSWVIAY
jgi:ADP-ribosylglycohydrolase